MPASHDNPFGQRLTALMISRRIVDTSVPMSLLADHPNVQFNYFRGGLGTCASRCTDVAVQLRAQLKLASRQPLAASR